MGESSGVLSSAPTAAESALGTRLHFDCAPRALGNVPGTSVMLPSSTATTLEDAQVIPCQAPAARDVCSR